MYAQRQPLSLEQIHRVAPSVFATEPFEEMSDQYRFVPTSEVLHGLLDQGFKVVDANQTNVRKEARREHARHVLRLQHDDMPESSTGEIPELIVLNSHDGTSSYQIMLGFYRMVCSNGLICGSAVLPPTRILHRGDQGMIDDVIEGSFETIKKAPQAIAQIEEWKGIDLERFEQEALAEAAYELRGSTIEVPTRQLLGISRFEDKKDDVWTVMNRVQENIVRGRLRGVSETNNIRKVQGIKSVDADTKFNKALWNMTERLVEAKAAGDYTKIVEAKELETA